MTDAMVIDTNVLEHVFHPIINGDGHIERLLRKFSEQRHKLCIDRPPAGQRSRIIEEYNHRLRFHLRGMQERGQVTQWLRYVLVLAERVDTPVDLSDKLGRFIVPQMDSVRAERSDQIFVYVACALDSVMVSNNSRHVTDIRVGLRRAARKVGSKNTEFFSSAEAEGIM
jgi:hypothetical protein